MNELLGHGVNIFFTFTNTTKQFSTESIPTQSLIKKKIYMENFKYMCK